MCRGCMPLGAGLAAGGADTDGGWGRLCFLTLLIIYAKFRVKDMPRQNFLLSQEELAQLKQRLLANDVVFAALFGSYAKGGVTSKSDIDILIKYRYGADKTLFDLIGLRQELEELLHKKVDLVTMGALNKYIKNEVLGSMKIIYEAR